MNAVEIEEAVSKLAEAPFDAAEFPFAFLEAFGNKSTTLKRLKSGSSNQSDLPAGVLQRNHIHISTSAAGDVVSTLAALRDSPVTVRQKAKFILATDGKDFQAENLVDGGTVACDYADFHEHFGFFLPLAGITTVKQISENAFDIKATGRLNRLYVELLKENPDWATSERREDLNHFFARLIFCFFAEDTGIFPPLPSPSGGGAAGEGGLFTDTLQRMSASDSSNTHEVLEELFRAMNTKPEDHETEQIRNWARPFPYVNGGLFSGSMETPRFSKIARSYLLHVGGLDWTKINPDIFGSMIQAVADDEERGALGMHYTSVPNILKVLNPLFLDDLRTKLDEAGDNARKLLNLRNRMARIRVFDPACGSGNFLVIAYKEMREIEAEINRRRGETGRHSEIPLTNFRGIELRHFSAEIARLALIIAEYQCDVLHRGPVVAREEFLPLERDNWITCGNALRLDWLKICPPTGTGVKVRSDDLFETPLDQAEIDFENEGGETFICGNPPYSGSRKQAAELKQDLKDLFSRIASKWKSLDYVACWLLLAANYMKATPAECGLVCTKSLCQGLQVSILWQLILQGATRIRFCYRPFKWSNLSANNAGVTVVIVGFTNKSFRGCTIFDEDNNVRAVSEISPYLTPGKTIYVDASASPRTGTPRMVMGSMPRDGGNLIASHQEASDFSALHPDASHLLRPYVGSDELISGQQRRCFWIEDSEQEFAASLPELNRRITAVERFRESSSLSSTREFARQPHRFVYLAGKAQRSITAVAAISSERRPYLPVDLMPPMTVVSNKCYAIYDAALDTFAILVSRMHLTWVAAVCVRLETRFSYSNTLGWNTFPVPTLTEQNKSDLTHCAEEILLAREAHFPATIADLYDPDAMPTDLRAAHDRNDETLERIYIGRRFKNDTERLEKLFELYTQMTEREASVKGAKASKKPAGRKKKGAGS